jgi:dihydropteroate synthase
MGILNVTPDSFSDGGDLLDPHCAVAAGRGMVAEGADILDIGGESTRPGSEPTPPDEEQARILPVIAGLRDAGAPISVDTRNATTMAAALDAGAAIINDVSALQHDPAAAALIAARGCLVILMHMRGTPATMNSLAEYDDVAAEVAAELGARLGDAFAAGIRREQIALDPGIGFAKQAEHNVALLRNLQPLLALGCPVVAGVSRKRFIGAIGGHATPKERSAGSLAAGLFALQAGARVLRVHDVAGTVEAVKVWHALSS